MSSYAKSLLLWEKKVTPSETRCTFQYHHHNTIIRNKRHCFPSPDACRGGYEHLFVVTNHFTNYVQFYPTRNKSTRLAADKIYNNFFLRFVISEKILSEQGGEFQKTLFKYLSRLCRVQQLHATPYHPKVKGKTECMNSLICAKLKTLSENRNTVEKIIWTNLHMPVNALPTVLLVITLITCLSLPIGIILRNHIAENTKMTRRQYITKYQEVKKEAYNLAVQRSKNIKMKDKEPRNRGACLRPLCPGERVLIRNLPEREGIGTLRAYWEDDVGEIVQSKRKKDLFHAVQPKTNTKTY